MPDTEKRYDSTADTLEHIKNVQVFIFAVVADLTARGRLHDASKLVEPEKSGYDRLVLKLSDCKYGSAEYQAAMVEAADTIKLHYAANDHHPEHHNPDHGIEQMNLLQILEMLCDWKAASMRTKQGSIRGSLEHNAKRFNIPPSILNMLYLTVDYLGW